MVIQRNWKNQNESTGNNNNNIIQQQSSTSSSEDSNGSNQTISSSNTTSSSKGQIPPKFVTTPEMANNILTRLKQRYGNNIIMGQKSCHEAEAVMRSLELLRINIQAAFDKEIDLIVKKFLETYFRPAFKNIKENLGDHVGSEDILTKMSCALIENSKSQYNTRVTQPSKNILIVTTSNNGEQHHIQQQSVVIKPEISTQTTSNIQPTASSALVLKRPPIENTTSLSNIQAKKPIILQQRIVTPTSGSPPQIITPPRRQIFWNTANVSAETRFLLDVQANQAFGFSPDGRERLASKHPELIRYLPDGQDRDWLVQQKIIPAQNRNSRFLFLVYDEVIKLGQSELYKRRENLNLQILHAFKIPSFVIQKMKMFFIDLNIKSRGLITNSYTTSIVNVQHTTSRSGLVGGGVVTIPTNVVSNSGSQLRNALLQGSQAVIGSAVVSTTGNSISSSEVITGPTNVLVTLPSVVSTSSEIVRTNIVGQQLVHQSLQLHQPTKIVTAIVKPKMQSSLSSSHATLTALLTNNNGGNNNKSNNNNDNGNLVQPKQSLVENATAN